MSTDKPYIVPTGANGYGGELTAGDYKALADRWIDRKYARIAKLTRVEDHVGRDLLRQPKKDCSGVFIPYFLPEEGTERSFRIRRDHPEMEGGKPKAKYMTQPGERLKFYIPVGTPGSSLRDAELPIILTEGEFKAIALARLAVHEAPSPRFLPISIPGVWTWHGTIGKTTDAKGARVDEKGVIPDFDRVEWSGRQVVIAFDSDTTAKADVRAARSMLSRELRRRGAQVGILRWDQASGKGVDDWLASAGPEPVLKAISAVDFNRVTGWKAALRCSVAKDGSQGNPKALMMNADIALRTCPDWEGVLAFDEFRQRVIAVASPPIGGPVPRDWTDADDTKTAIWMQQQGIELGHTTVGPTVQAVALDNSIHPLRDWLDSLAWDGTPRVDNWLIDYLGAAPSDTISAIGRMWLISCIARVKKPGCQVDHMLILEGQQGTSKSSALRILAGDEYFTDHMPPIELKDASLQLFGKWIIEWGELESMTRSQIETIKNFITRRIETLRPPYGKRTEDIRRQCVFAGSTNSAQYLKDSTGNRRFWPVAIGTIDTQKLKEDREQLWAEAVYLYNSGAKWWADRPELVAALGEEQETRVEVDVWMNPIELFIHQLKLKQDVLAAKDYKVTAEEILSQCFNITDVAKQAQVEKNRIGRCLRQLGFVAGRWTNPGDENKPRIRGYLCPKPLVD